MLFRGNFCAAIRREGLFPVGTRFLDINMPAEPLADATIVYTLGVGRDARCVSVSLPAADMPKALGAGAVIEWIQSRIRSAIEPLPMERDARAFRKLALDWTKRASATPKRA